jgi:hypothetical protein
VVERPTFIVVDRASIHTRNAIFDKLEERKERGLTIFELPTYNTSDSFRSSRVSETLAAYMLDYFFFHLSKRAKFQKMRKKW